MNKVLFLTAALVFSGCGSDHDRLPQDDNNDVVAADQMQDAEFIGFDEVFEFIIKDNCISCHKNYDTESTVLGKAEEIINRLKGLGPGAPMPQGRPALDDELIMLFEGWAIQEAM